MEFIILGLLMFKNLTIYEINRHFKENMSLIYSASYGSIQNAILKLSKREEISFNEIVESGRNKKIYSINPSGIKAFYTWMMDDVKTNKLEVQMLSKIYFLGLIKTKEDKLSIVGNILNEAKSQLDEIEALDEELSNLTLDEETMSIAKYQFKTLDYGLMSHRHGYKWLQELYTEIENS